MLRKNSTKSFNHCKSRENRKTKKIRSLKGTKPLVTAKKRRIDDDLKKAEIQLAVTSACHFSISAVDHVGEVIAKIPKESF